MKLSVQLYTLRDQLQGDFFGTLEKVKAMGIHHVEFAGFGDNTPEKVKAELDRIGLKAHSGHFMINFAEDNTSELVATAKTLGLSQITQPWLGEEHYKDGWANTAKKFEPYAQKIVEAGLKFAYHNHAFEFSTEENGKFGLENFYAASDPGVISAQLDVFWVAKGGDDPVRFIELVKGRANTIHLKDGKLEGNVFMPAGQGEIDLKAVVAAAKAAGIEYGIIELDQSPKDPLLCVQESADYLRSLGIED